MIGYTSRILFILPMASSYSRASKFEIGRMIEAITNAASYFEKTFGVRPVTVATEDFIQYFGLPKGLGLISSLAKEDITFVKRNCEGMDDLDIDNLEYLEKDVLQKSRTKVPIPGPMSIEERFDVVLRREKLNMKSLIEETKVVVSFEHLSKSRWNCKPNIKADRIVVQVNPGNYVIRSTLYGESCTLDKITGDDTFNRPIQLWR